MQQGLRAKLNLSKRKEMREQYDRFYARVALDQRKRVLGWALAVILLLLVISVYLSYA